MPNDGHVNCVIPTADGALVVPQFVQCRGSGEVEVVVGREHGEPVYISEIYLAPNYSCIPTDPIGVWFLQLLRGPMAGFNALAEALHELPNWKPYTEAMHYRKWEEEQQLVEAEISELTGHSAILQESIDNCQSQLKARGVLFMVCNLKGYTNLPHGQNQNTH